MHDIPLRVEGARKRFGDTQALDGASFEVRRGELLGLLGPNGAGKTTLIRAIAGRVALDEGRILVNGTPLGLRDPRPDIGVVPQELAIYPLLTARENLRAFGELYGVDAATLRSRIDWALEWADLKDRANEPVKKFSGGMKRRLNIAIGLLHAPKVVLLDEPTVGVDPQSRERIYDMLTALLKDGTSVVLTTHHLEEAEQRCQRIVIIDHGRIVAAGSLRELLAAGGQEHSSAKVVVRTTRVESEAIVQSLRQAGLALEQIDVHSGSLQDVFIALTGRELRE
jgi:ABC-2 type transport system ATP-binding protein